MHSSDMIDLSDNSNTCVPDITDQLGSQSHGSCLGGTYLSVAYLFMITLMRQWVTNLRYCSSFQTGRVIYFSGETDLSGMI
jgi:hypothetical protein